MGTYDFSPLWRSTIGFDRLFDLAEAAHRAGEDNYPPYNIERLGDDRYQISLAVAEVLSERLSNTDAEVDKLISLTNVIRSTDNFLRRLRPKFLKRKPKGTPGEQKEG